MAAEPERGLFLKAAVAAHCQVRSLGNFKKLLSSEAGLTETALDGVIQRQARGPGPYLRRKARTYARVLFRRDGGDSAEIARARHERFHRYQTIAVEGEGGPGGGGFRRRFARNETGRRATDMQRVHGGLFEAAPGTECDRNCFPPLQKSTSGRASHRLLRRKREDCLITYWIIQS